MSGAWKGGADSAAQPRAATAYNRLGGSHYSCSSLHLKAPLAWHVFVPAARQQHGAAAAVLFAGRSVLADAPTRSRIAGCCPTRRSEAPLSWRS